MILNAYKDFKDMCARNRKIYMLTKSLFVRAQCSRKNFWLLRAITGYSDFFTRVPAAEFCTIYPLLSTFLRKLSDST